MAIKNFAAVAMITNDALASAKVYILQSEDELAGPPELGDTLELTVVSIDTVTHEELPLTAR